MHMCVCVCAYVCACVRACVCAYVCACMRAYMCVCDLISTEEAALKYPVITGATVACLYSIVDEDLKGTLDANCETKY